jgi:putative endonuclease
VVPVRNRQLGVRGENEAVRFLSARGFVILDRNWRCTQGELDIVAQDGVDLVFVEVKARSSLRFGHPFEAVTGAKLARLRSLTVLWRDAHPRATGPSRIDVVSIVMPDHDGDIAVASPHIEHLRGVFA